MWPFKSEKQKLEEKFNRIIEHLPDTILEEDTQKIVYIDEEDILMYILWKLEFKSSVDLMIALYGLSKQQVFKTLKIIDNL